MAQGVALFTVVMATKTTKADFELFKKECLRWKDILGLHGFEFNFNHNGEDRGDFSYCAVNSTNRTVMLELCIKWPGKKYIKTDAHIKMSAFHEVCHVFLDLLGSVARYRYISQHEVEEAEHAIIRTLETVLYPKY